MARKPPTYQTLPTDSPIWVSEPFRVFFPLGILAGLAGLLLWPLHYAGLWQTYPAIQHPRLLVFGFGAAFVFGFLGTAWPRFLEAEALKLWELVALAFSWLSAQSLYLLGSISGGDFAAAWSCLLLLFILGRRLFGRESNDLPPPGFALAFSSVTLATIALFCWANHWGDQTLPGHHLLRLVAYQGFLLFPLMGVGSYLFGRFFQIPGQRPPVAKPKFRALAVWSAAGIILISFVVEAFGWTRSGNGLRLAGLLVWALGAVPGIWRAKAPNTRAWALRGGLLMIALTFLIRVIWPNPLHLIAYEHLLFLGGFSLVILLTADRVIIGHCAAPQALPPVSKAWRWIFWLIFLTAATRINADLIPSTRVSHHIYAAIMLGVIYAIWLGIHGRRFRQLPPPEKE